MAHRRDWVVGKKFTQTIIIPREDLSDPIQEFHGDSFETTSDSDTISDECDDTADRSQPLKSHMHTFRNNNPKPLKNHTHISETEDEDLCPTTRTSPYSK